MRNSWKTTLAGLATLSLALFSTYRTGAVTPDTATAITVGLGLLFARDNDKSSEDVKIKK